MHSLEHGETPSNSASHHTMILNSTKNGEIMTKINLPQPECNRTGTGNIFNLIMRMTVVGSVNEAKKI